MTKLYYAGYSYMGVGYAYDSSCWTLHVFDSRQERNAWCEDCYDPDTGNIVVEPVTRRAAERIIGGRGKLSTLRGYVLAGDIGTWERMYYQGNVIVH